ncbi:uncharacterized protein LOC133711875 [Rosa rugosa]|uniref:uncharacterized protein LOC133711875 n=1 Tax=Rosa rugosa TaxID=74645 RepID=UPI002B40989D|nr:uncharacterized protein LOC133711875 [Rosa rugosa]
MPYCDLVLNRRFPAPLENGFLPGTPDYSDRARMAFRRAISCSDIRLAVDELTYELYAPNHFARQFGLIQLGRAPPSSNRAAGFPPATGPAAKQKAKLSKPEVEDSFSDDDDPQTIAAALARKRSRAEFRTDLWATDEPVADRLVRRRFSRQVGEGSSAAGEGVSGTPAQETNGDSPSAINVASNMQLGVVPAQVIDDSSPEFEERLPLLHTPREQPILLLESAVPDSGPTSGETAPIPTVDSRELPVEEDPNVEVVVGEIADEAPAEPVPNVVGEEPAPHAPLVIEVEEIGALPEPVPEAIPVAEPLEAPIAEQPTPSTLERLARVLEVTPPGVVDDAREGLRRLLGPDILTPGAPTRVLEYLRVLLREGAISEDQFQEVD